VTTGPERVRLDRATVDRLVEHAWSDHPYEVCGLLGLRPDGGIEHFPITNAERSMTYYVMDGKELLRAMRTIEDEGWDLVIYHSHSHTEAYPSRTDVELAAYPDATYLIVSLEDRDHPALRAFRIRDGAVSEVELEIADDAAA
jgi:[CysO sulfur-carrier protein]-S-L-cysteine hydrolase